MSGTDSEKRQELARLQARAAELESELQPAPSHWQADEFYLAYYAMAGGILGMAGAMVSLLFNVVGSTMVHQHPLRLIQIYLTFPAGEKALELDGGLTLTLGCCLYIATGAVLGVPFYVLLRYFTAGRSLTYRFAFASGLALSMWVVHFYCILIWLQPLLFNGRWIVDLVPIWVGALTHLIYGWTITITYPFGDYKPYYRQTEQNTASQ